MTTAEEIRAAIVQRDDYNGWSYIRYEPGNGTRYNIIQAIPLDERALTHFGAIKSSVLYLWLHHGFIILSNSTTPLHWIYVSEKLRCNETDAKRLTELFGFLLGREWIT